MEYIIFLAGELHSVKEIYDLVANHLSVDKDVPIVDPEEDDVQKVCSGSIKN